MVSRRPGRPGKERATLGDGGPRAAALGVGLARVGEALTGPPVGQRTGPRGERRAGVREGGPRSGIAVGYLRRSTDRQEQSIPDQQRAVETTAPSTA
jgi:hypothetical protein